MDLLRTTDSHLAEHSSRCCSQDGHDLFEEDKYQAQAPWDKKGQTGGDYPLTSRPSSCLNCVAQQSKDGHNKGHCCHWEAESL